MVDMQQVLLHLSLIDGIGPSAVTQVIDRKPTSIEWSDLYRMSLGDLQGICGLTPGIAQKIAQGLADHRLLADELALVQKHRISYITILDPAYPSLLKHIHLPPPVLYSAGSLPHHEANKRIAIVGSRKANSYAQRVVESLVPQLVEQGFEIVSGGALGVDSMAHRATVQATGKTIVVLGSGLLYRYPYENKKLFEQVIDLGGALISTFPMKTRPFPGNFPARNRVISGISDGCVVVQAAEQSGARITAQFSLEQGRHVFAIPGSLEDELSAGCHALIREGATLVRDARDILQEFGVAIAEQDVQPRDSVDKLTPHQRAIIAACARPCSIDELGVQTQLGLSELQGLLFELQLKGDVQQDFMGMWRAN